MKPEKQSLIGIALVVIAGLGLILLIVFVIWPFLSLQTKINQTREKVKQEAIRHLKLEGDPIPEEFDNWGSPLNYHYETGTHDRSATVTSPGPDKQLGTSDDIQARKVDLNKSRIVGEWVGSKAKEAGKGFMDGLKQKSPFRDKSKESD